MPESSLEPSPTYGSEFNAAVMREQAMEAKLWPRDEKAAKKHLLKCARSPAWVERVTIPNEDDGSLIVSIRCIREFLKPEAFRNFGYGNHISAIGHETDELTGWIFDAEGNHFASKTILLRKTQKQRSDTGFGWKEPRRLTEAELLRERHRGYSLVVRRLVLDFLPEDIIEAVLDRCRTTLDKYGDMLSKSLNAEVAADYVKKLGLVGVSLAMIEKRLGHGVDKIDGHALLFLGGAFRAIEDGSVSPDQYFGPSDTQPSEFEKRVASSEEYEVHTSTAPARPPLRWDYKNGEVVSSPKSRSISDAAWGAKPPATKPPEALDLDPNDASH